MIPDLVSVPSRDDPVVSVIILAHKPREYLFEAVMSALQGSDRQPAFEIILVKPFEHPDWDLRFKSLGVRLVTCKKAGAGAKLAEGCRSARGNIIAFLEDDDAFEFGKLETIIRVFQGDPELVYFHHDQRAVDAQGHTLGWIHGTPGFNLSSVAVRKEFLLRHLTLFEALPAASDKMLYYLIRISGAPSLHSGLLLTRYRIHEENRHLRYDPTEDWLLLASYLRHVPTHGLKEKLIVAYLVSSSSVLVTTRLLLGRRWGSKLIRWYSWALWFRHRHEVLGEKPRRSHPDGVPMLTPL